MRYLFTLCLVTSVLMSAAQMSYDDIDYTSIPYKKVRKYIQDQQNKANIQTLAEIQPTCQSEYDFSDYAVCTRTYFVKASPDVVWQAYTTASPTQAWKTRKSNCALVYERKDDRLVYSEEETGGTHTGQVLFMNLRLVKGLYNLATAFEITRVEDESAVIEVTYTESGINEGKQVIEMHETEEGYTEIVHTSMVKSGSNFRDRVLYPYFHSKLIRAFHKKMRRNILAEQSASS